MEFSLLLSLHVKISYTDGYHIAALTPAAARSMIPRYTSGSQTLSRLTFYVFSGDVPDVKEFVNGVH